MESVDLPKVDTVGSTFYACDALTDVNLPNAKVIGGPRSIQDYGAFSYCYSLKKIILPEVDSIGNLAFDHCESLQTASFPKLTRIGLRTFQSCDDLSYIFLPATPPSINEDISGTDSLSLVIVDEKGTKLTGDAYTSAVEAYKSDAGYVATTGKWYGLILTADNIPLAVEAPEVNGSVWSDEGCIYVRTDKQTALTVYNVGGQIVKNTVVSSGTNTVSDLTPGIYVVRFGKSKSIKMYVK